jgi:hypothetical protein
MKAHIAATLALTFLSQVYADLDVDTQDVPVACQASKQISNRISTFQEETSSICGPGKEPLPDS